MRGVLVLLALGACAPEVDAAIPDLVPDPVTDEKGDLVFGDAVGYVITPAGLVHGSCVYNVGEDSVVQANEVTIDDSGRARLPPCRFPAQLSAHADDALPSVDGWAEAAWWDAASTPTKLVATWTVPPAPKDDHGQIIYFFPSLEPSDSSAIVQPVLQWGKTPAGGGSYWAVGSWYVTSTDQAVHSSLLKVNPGDVLTGTITSSGCASGTCKFVITTRDNTSGHYRRLTISDHQPYPAVQSAVLEVYGVDQCSDLPDTRESLFSSVSVTGAGTPSWTPRVFATDPACGYRVSFSGNNATLAY